VLFYAKDKHTSLFFSIANNKKFNKMFVTLGSDIFAFMTGTNTLAYLTLLSMAKKVCIRTTCVSFIKTIVPVRQGQTLDYFVQSTKAKQIYSKLTFVSLENNMHIAFWEQTL
jgi:hypothetical protein